MFIRKLQEIKRNVSSRWVDINKNDDEKRNYRNRMVTQDFNDGNQMIENLLAGTPPLEIVRINAATGNCEDVIKRGSNG